MEKWLRLSLWFSFHNQVVKDVLVTSSLNYVKNVIYTNCHEDESDRHANIVLVVSTAFDVLMYSAFFPLKWRSLFWHEVSSPNKHILIPLQLMLLEYGIILLVRNRQCSYPLLWFVLNLLLMSSNDVCSENKIVQVLFFTLSNRSLFDCSI